MLQPHPPSPKTSPKTKSPRPYVPAVPTDTIDATQLETCFELPALFWRVGLTLPVTVWKTTVPCVPLRSVRHPASGGGGDGGGVGSRHKSCPACEATLPASTVAHDRTLYVVSAQLPGGTRLHPVFLDAERTDAALKHLAGSKNRHASRRLQHFVMDRITIHPADCSRLQLARQTGDPKRVAATVPSATQLIVERRIQNLGTPRFRESPATSFNETLLSITKELNAVRRHSEAAVESLFRASGRRSALVRRHTDSALLSLPEVGLPARRLTTLLRRANTASLVFPGCPEGPESSGSSDSDSDSDSDSEDAEDAEDAEKRRASPVSAAKKLP